MALEQPATKLWATATGEDARAAFAAMADLTAVPDRTVEVIRRQMKPVRAAPTDADLDRIFAELDSEILRRPTLVVAASTL